MIGRGLFILTALSTCVLSLPVTSSQLENDDVKVMKCVVEALADVLSRPQPIPVSQECVAILKTDDRLVTILRHHNFLKELQEIAVQGDQERAQPQTDAASPLDPPTPNPQATDASDRSMLEALGGPGERSILSQKKRRGNRDGDKGESPRDGESLEEDDIIDQMQVKREDDESPGSHISAEDRSEGKAEKRKEEEEEEVEEGSEEKRGNSEEENMTMDRKGSAEKGDKCNSKEKTSGEKGDKCNSKEKTSGEKGDKCNSKEKTSGEKGDKCKSKEKTSGEKGDKCNSKEKTSAEKDKEEKDKRSSDFARKHKEEKEEDVKRGSRENLRRWSKRGKGLQLKKKAHEEEAEEGDSQQEVPHHSKEVPDDDEGQKKKKKRGGQQSPEEEELQMISRRSPERNGLEEEGSASRKSEEPEIESLAAIESELENVAQKLHELRRG